ncbi:MAG: hypothetical protein EXX96DRAFT_539375 [Benjaminiella poitrasii]|nr:MAG: hypothetical protein EXX96DRAFT_539375 [Benjaminiella poitrasii]
MSIDCSICYESLITTGHTAVIPCGHMFHIGCISTWMENSRTCPLCKKKFNARQMISPVFFTGNDHNAAESNIATSSTDRIEQLLAELASLQKKNEWIQADNETLTDKLVQEKKRSDEYLQKWQHATKSMRYLKQIRKVADMDDEMSSPTSQAYLNGLRSSAKNDLLVTLGAMKARCIATSRQHNDIIRRLEILERDNLHLKRKLERVKQKNQPQQQQQQQQSIPRRYPGVIILDDSDDDNGETADQDSSERSDDEVIIQENVDQPERNVDVDEKNCSGSYTSVVSRRPLVSNITNKDSFTPSRSASYNPALGINNDDDDNNSNSNNNGGSSSSSSNNNALLGQSNKRSYSEWLDSDDEKFAVEEHASSS